MLGSTQASSTLRSLSLHVTRKQRLSLYIFERISDNRCNARYCSLVTSSSILPGGFDSRRTVREQQHDHKIQWRNQQLQFITNSLSPFVSYSTTSRSSQADFDARSFRDQSLFTKGNGSNTQNNSSVADGSSSYSASDSPGGGDVGKSEKKGTFSMLWKKYGTVFVCTYLSVYVSTLGFFFVGIDVTGLLDPISWGLLGEEASGKTTVDFISDLLQGYSWTEKYAPLVKDHPRWANFALAWISTKPTEPIRLGITAVLTPRIARQFGYAVDEKKKK